MSQQELRNKINRIKESDTSSIREKVNAIRGINDVEEISLFQRGKQKLKTFFLGPEPTAPVSTQRVTDLRQIQARQEEISQAQPSFFQRATGFLPEGVQNFLEKDIARPTRELLFGSDQKDILPIERTGEQRGVFRDLPLVSALVPRSNEEKYFSRYSKLLQQGVSKERADEISKEFITPSYTERVKQWVESKEAPSLFDKAGNYGLTKEQADRLQLTKKEVDALRPTAISEFVDFAFGFLDIPSVGVMGTIAKTSVKKIAASQSKNFIKEEILKSSRNLPDQAIDNLADTLVYIKDPKIAQETVEEVEKMFAAKALISDKVEKLKQFDRTVPVSKSTVFDIQDKGIYARIDPDIADAINPENFVIPFSADDIVHTSQIQSAARKGREISLAEMFKQSPNSKRAFELAVDIKASKIEPRLIADNDLRVVSRDGQDVYQYKVDGQFKNASTREKAIQRVLINRSKQIAPKATDVKTLTPAQEGKALQLEIREDTLDNSPYKNPNNRFFVDREGRVLSLGDMKSPKLTQKLEDAMAEAGINDPEIYRAGLEDFFQQKKQLATDKKAFNQEIKANKKIAKQEDVPKKDIDNFLAEEARKYDSAEEFIEAQVNTERFSRSLKEDNQSKFGDTKFFAEKGEDIASGGNLSDVFGKIETVQFVDESSLFKEGINSRDFLQREGFNFNKPNKLVRELTGEDTLAKAIDNLEEKGDIRAFLASQKIAEDLLKKQGFKGAKWVDEDFLVSTQYQIWDDSAIKTKSQLRDIYNQAKKTVTESKAPIKRPQALEEKRATNKEELKLSKERKAVETPTQKESPSSLSRKSSDEPRNLQELKQTPEAESLQKLAQQSVESIQIPKQAIPLEKIITQTPVKQKVSAVDYFRTPDRVLKKIGLEKEAKLLRKKYQDYLKELPDNIETISDWRKRVPEKESAEKIFKYLDGEDIKLANEELEVADEIRAYLDNWADRLGLPEENRVTNYITHLFEDQLIAKEFDEDLAKIIKDKIPGSVYNPFLEKRLGALGYKQNVWEALDAYTKRATRKVHMDDALSKVEEVAENLEDSQWTYMKRYFDRINLRPTEIDSLVDNMVKTGFGYRFGQRPVTSVARALRRWTYRGMLGLNLSSALRNLSQGINTFAALGEKYTTLGYASLFKKGAFKELEEVGALQSGFIEDGVISSFKKNIMRMDKVLFSFFEGVERINRGAAYFGAKARALKQGKSLADATEEGFEMARKTQFKFDPIDTPQVLSSDLAKTLGQFQSFTLKQIEFLSELSKDKKGLSKLLPYLRYVGAGAIFVHTAGKAFNMEEKELVPSFRFGFPPSLQGLFEIARAAADAPDAYGNDRDNEQKIKDIFKGVKGLIPAGVQAHKTINGILAVKEGGEFTKDNRFKYKVGETPAQKLQAMMFGTYSTQNAKEYRDRIKDADKAKKKLLPKYTKIQDLAEDGQEQKAREMLDTLTDQEYETYKKIKQDEESARTLEMKREMTPMYFELQNMKKEGNEAQAQSILDRMTDEEYDAYKRVKKDMSDLEKASKGEKPEFGEKEYYSDKSLIHLIWTYAKGAALDPETAWQTLTTDEEIANVYGNAVIMKRIPLSQSEEIRRERGVTSSNKDQLRLDHTIPVALGGDNSEKNLELVPTEVWSSYTPVENFLIRELKEGNIKENEAQELIRQFKEGKITKNQIINR